MATRGSYLNLLGGEISTSHLLWLPVASVSADQVPKKLYPLGHVYNYEASTSLQPSLVKFTMGPSASNRLPATPDPSTL